MESTWTEWKEKAEQLVKQMTLSEKAGLCSGSNFWETKDVARLGIKKMMVTDGPHGLRKQAGDSDHLGINKSIPATCFPTAATIACSFDKDLLYEMGQALGEECLQEHVSVLLGPGVNIKRSPLCGRNFEYISEDPYLTGKMASALIKGIQSKGIGTCMKHYAANNQETRRMVINSVVDERALREIYLTGFEIAVKEAKPYTLMCSYNQINGEYGSQNKKLLTDILREEWKFDGAVMTDWGACDDRVKGLFAGLDLEMPYNGPENDNTIVEAVTNGSLGEDVLNTAAARVVSLLLALESKTDEYQYDKEAHHELARKVAANSAVLLKNQEKLLPLQKSQTIAVLGEFAKAPRYQGAGSSRINPIHLTNLCEVLSQQGVSYMYAPGYDLSTDEPVQDKLIEAAEIAKNAEVAIICIGLPDEYESEGFDREHLRLPKSHIALLEEIAKVNANTVVLLFGGSAVEMPWIAEAKALLMLYLGGEAGAQATADLLYGVVNPSGKLAESFPLKLEDTPCYLNFPGGDKTVEYRESIYVGYRYYDKVNAEVMFPFGFGLSYTEFLYTRLTVVKSGEELIAKVKIKNTGDHAGAEAVQFYISQNQPSVFHSVRELKEFQKIYLEAGEERTVSVTFDQRAFSYYHIKKQDWCTETGEYTIAVGASSRDLRCEVAVHIDGECIEQEKELASYKNPSFPFSVSREEFEQLYGSELPPASCIKGEPFTAQSTLNEISATKTGSDLIAKMQQQMAGMLGSNTDGDESMNRMFQHMMGEMPVRALKMSSQGRMTNEVIANLIIAMNKEQ